MQDARKKLQDEVSRIQRELTHELPLELKLALEHGDLRENAEYQAAKERQSYLQSKLAQLRHRLSALSMVNLDKIPRGKVSYGSTVLLHDVITDTDVTYKLVSPEEADVGRGMISTSSPIGKSLMGKEEGDEIQIRTPGGVKEYEIKKLTTIHDEL
ncbi:MAG: transcription elongation factor GreA [Acidobacteria bacterium]|nr:transcription elongation factor GreA [Acidobacteriota bacterium]